MPVLFECGPEQREARDIPNAHLSVDIEVLQTLIEVYCELQTRSRKQH